MNFREIQTEQFAWSLKNFGPHDPWQPLLGIVEEYGEYTEAKLKRDIEEQIDALADMIIFAMDFCSTTDINSQEIWEKRSKVAEHDKDMFFLGKICHHHLKSVQRIRGTKEEHKLAVRAYLAKFFGNLDIYATFLGFSLEKEVERVWMKVRERDWNKFRETQILSKENND